MYQEKLIKFSFMFVGGDTYQEGLACYRLGNAYEGISEHDVAIQVRLLSLFVVYGMLVND